MQKSKERLKLLLENYFDQTLQPEELTELSDYILDKDYQSELEQLFPDAYNSDIQFTDLGMEQKVKQNILSYIFNYSTVETKSIETKQGKSYKMWWYLRAAAVLLLLTPVIWFYTSRSKKINQHPSYASTIVPGRNTATLKLADGKVINLSEAKTGLTVRHDLNTASQLSYNDGSAIDAPIPSSVNQLNELSTPKGGQYQITLPDGTKVWLNALSTLKFPSNFAKSKQRKVELIGEAYFEVTKKSALSPFIVISQEQEVKVLGTHFNVNSYPDEKNIKTTLLEGVVQVTSLKNQSLSSTLKPGMQSTLSSKEIVLQKLNDPESVISWQSGYFTFDREHLDEIMRKVSRWYDVNIVYKEESIKTLPFSGTITRFAQVSELIKMLELTGKVTIEQTGRTLIVNRK